MPSLIDPLSASFQHLAGIIEEELLDVLRLSLSNIATVQVTGFRNGSIIVEYRVIMTINKPPRGDEAVTITEAISKAIKEGLLDTIKADESFPIVVKGKLNIKIYL